MKDLWREIALHRGTVVFFAVYWLATVLTGAFAWLDGVPNAVVVLLLSNCLIWGALTSWWRGQSAEHTYSAGSRIRHGALAGILVGEITLLVMKGGTIHELIGWIRGWPHFGQWDEVLGFTLAIALIGALLGSIGAAASALMQRRSR